MTSLRLSTNIDFLGLENRGRSSKSIGSGLDLPKYLKLDITHYTQFVCTCDFDGFTFWGCREVMDPNDIREVFAVLPNLYHQTLQ